MLNSLAAEPITQEIIASVHALGPNGPDGFNAKTIQDRWEAFGPAVLNEVHGYFPTGRMH